MIYGADKVGMSGYQTVDPSPQPSPLDRLLQSLSRLEDSTAMVQHTTDNLCGSQPTDGITKGANSEPAPAGHFAAISLSANRIDRMAQTIADCMQRIQRVAG